MSKVLIIRHLPEGLSFKDKELLLKHFGAEKVWEPKSKRKYVFAAFSSVDLARASLIRLHQLEIAQRKLVVEFSIEQAPISSSKKEIKSSSATTQKVKEFLHKLNAWNPSIDFYQPPPVHLRYKYPDLTAKVVINIVHALFLNKPFCTQTLHLMNKMSLESPFRDSEKSLEFFKETFSQFFTEPINVSLPPESEPESELSSDENGQETRPAPAVKKRKHILPVTRKRPAAVLSTASLPKTKKTNVTQEEVFETVIPIQESKKISVVVPQDALNKQSDAVEVIGELGKFQKEEQSVEAEEAPVETEQPTISKKELLRNRISYRDMKVLSVFKNYHPGQPSMRLYIKNLAKTVTEQDLKRIYRRYVEALSDDDQIGFDVRVMQEGRMKGQAFVTFPSVTLAESALHETNGYLLKEKPMVVQFARVANKKSVE